VQRRPAGRCWRGLEVSAARRRTPAPGRTRSPYSWCPRRPVPRSAPGRSIRRGGPRRAWYLHRTGDQAVCAEAWVGVRGTQAQIDALVQKTQGRGMINTAYIERCTTSARIIRVCEFRSTCPTVDAGGCVGGLPLLLASQIVGGQLKNCCLFGCPRRPGSRRNDAGGHQRL
jgi:hypothetical protein